MVTIANSIAALSVTGVTIKDLDEIPDSAFSGACPIVYPRPDGFVSNFELERMAVTDQLTDLYNRRKIDEIASLFDKYDNPDVGTDIILVNEKWKKKS